MKKVLKGVFFLLIFGSVELYCMDNSDQDQGRKRGRGSLAAVSAIPHGGQIPQVPEVRRGRGRGSLAGVNATQHGEQIPQVPEVRQGRRNRASAGTAQQQEKTPLSKPEKVNANPKVTHAGTAPIINSAPEPHREIASSLISFRDELFDEYSKNGGRISVEWLDNHYLEWQQGIADILLNEDLNKEESARFASYLKGLQGEYPSGEDQASADTGSRGSSSESGAKNPKAGGGSSASERPKDAMPSGTFYPLRTPNDRRTSRHSNDKPERPANLSSGSFDQKRLEELVKLKNRKDLPESERTEFYRAVQDKLIVKVGGEYRVAEELTSKKGTSKKHSDEKQKKSDQPEDKTSKESSDNKRKKLDRPEDKTSRKHSDEKQKKSAQPKDETANKEASKHPHKQKNEDKPEATNQNRPKLLFNSKDLQNQGRNLKQPLPDDPALLGRLQRLVGMANAGRMNDLAQKKSDGTDNEDKNLFDQALENGWIKEIELTQFEFRDQTETDKNLQRLIGQVEAGCKLNDEDKQLFERAQREGRILKKKKKKYKVADQEKSKNIVQPGKLSHTKSAMELAAEMAEKRKKHGNESGDIRVVKSESFLLTDRRFNELMRNALIDADSVQSKLLNDNERHILISRLRDIENGRAIGSGNTRRELNEDERKVLDYLVSSAANTPSNILDEMTKNIQKRGEEMHYDSESENNPSDCDSSEW